MANEPAVMGFGSGDGWYGEHNGRMELILAWALLSNGTLAPVYADSRQIYPPERGKFWHPDQYREDDGGFPGLRGYSNNGCDAGCVPLLASHLGLARVYLVQGGYDGETRC
jgi:hypothetical protein